jgi:hypothetical protein
MSPVPRPTSGDNAEAARAPRRTLAPDPMLDAMRVAYSIHPTDPQVIALLNDFQRAREIVASNALMRHHHDLRDALHIKESTHAD